ncbi:hypothetical protein EGW08_009077 [Elysia chlorotica]|uniref:C2H2-type domain-containing protein n=1 Tax=Elysia chlorotica TaxID=188477 RepID=A0A3S1BGK3_ELYCH|nr:hypothetical protein EGW08_009077 [Elysia chlorotica]
MSMEESNILQIWDGFYSHYQYSNTPTPDRENVLMETVGTSILLDMEKSFAFELMKSCDLLGDKIVGELNYILWKLEEKCLPQIIVQFENFKRSLGSADVSQDMKTLGLVSKAVPLVESDSVVSVVDEDSTKTSVDDCNSPLHEKKRSNCILSNTLIKTESSRAKTKKTIIKCNEMSPDGSTRTENVPQISVRRSGRSVKISTRFQDVEDRIMKTIKGDFLTEKSSSGSGSEPWSINNKEKIETKQLSISYPPCICSYCKESSFSNELELLEHWKKHKEHVRGDKPFQCNLCDESFSTYLNLASHFGEHSDSELTQSNVDCKSSSVDKKSFTDVKTEVHVEDSNSCHERSCPLCNSVLKTEQSLEDHMQVHIPSSIHHSCDQCNETFSNMGSVRRHLLSHLGMSMKHHVCPFCGKMLKFERSLVAHVKKKHGEFSNSAALFQCLKCPKTFRTESQLDYHSVRHAGVKPYFCEVCGKHFLRAKGLANHMQMHQGGGHMCAVCGKTFVSARVLEDHSTIHTGEKPHVCDVCGKSFRLRANLRNHKQVHSENKGIQCSKCPKTFRDARSYSRHMLMHTGERPWRCAVCGKGFVQEITLKKHMNLHNGKNLHQCNVCLRSFVDKWGLLKHSTIHTGERPYECHVCHRTFRIKRGLEDHLKLHDASLQIKCPLCPKTFVEKRHLEHHLRVHRGEKAYVCEICGDRFVNTMSLKVHLRRHTGEKPYKCSYCPKTFNQHGTHAAHERFHRGERPYACDFCDAAFITHSQLNVHRRKHLNIRPYKCPQCDYAATTASLLKVHALKHSNEKPFRCSVCPAAFKRQNHLDVHTRKHQARQEVLVADGNTNIIHISEPGSGDQTEIVPPGSVTVVEVFQCSFCEASFTSQAALEKHTKRHEIIIVTAAANQDGIFEIPTIEGAHGASSEVAYDIVLL